VVHCNNGGLENNANIISNDEENDEIKQELETNKALEQSVPRRTR